MFNEDGKEVPVEHPARTLSREEILAIRRRIKGRWQAKFVADASEIQGGANLTFGTPRKGKNTKILIRGIRVS